VFVVTYVVFFSIGLTVRDKSYLYNSIEDKNCFYKGRMVGNYLYNTISDINDIIDTYQYDEYYVLGNFSYLVKLISNRDINKFDLINNGNMGFDGANRYIEEIDEYCSENKCLFILENREEESTNQTNVDILKYIEDNYLAQISGSIYKIYTN